MQRTRLEIYQNYTTADLKAKYKQLSNEKNPNKVLDLSAIDWILKQREAENKVVQQLKTALLESKKTAEVEDKKRFEKKTKWLKAIEHCRDKLSEAKLNIWVKVDFDSLKTKNETELQTLLADLELKLSQVTKMEKTQLSLTQFKIDPAFSLPKKLLFIQSEQFTEEFKKNEPNPAISNSML